LTETINLSKRTQN